MTVLGKSLLRREQEEGGADFDKQMIVNFKNELEAKSNLQVLTI